MVRSRLIRLISLLLLLLVLPFSARAEGEVAFTLRKDLSFSEPHSYSTYNQGVGSMAKVGLHTYFIPARIRENAARDYIARTEAALQALTALGAENRALNIHIVARDYPPRVEGNALYLGESSFASAEYVTGLVKLVFGNGVNYGLVYGVSCEIAATLGLPLEEALPLDAALSALSGEANIYLDLNYACFIAPYADEAMQANVRAVARAFVSSLTTEEKSALLTGYSDAAFYARLNQFLTAHGRPAREDQSMWGVAFHGGGIDIRLCWETELAVYAVDNTFQDLVDAETWSRFGAKDPLNSDYADLRRWVQIFEDHISRLQTKFAPYTEPVRPVILFEAYSFASHKKGSYNAYYRDSEKTAHIRTVDSVGHEYIHAMLYTTHTNWDMHEMVAYYYSEIVVPSILRVDYSYWMDSFRSYEDPESESYRDYWSALKGRAAAILGHTPDYAVTEDLICMMDLYVYTQGIADADVLDKDVINPARLCAKFSWWRYTSTVYGEDALLRAATENMPEVHLGKSWAEIVTEWLAWLETTYGPAQ